MHRASKFDMTTLRCLNLPLQEATVGVWFVKGHCYNKCHFVCCQIWRDIYMIIIALLFSAILMWQTRPRHYSPRWFRTRMLLYVGVTAYGVVPAVHWISLNGGLQAQVVQVMTIHVRNRKMSVSEENMFASRNSAQNSWINWINNFCRIQVYVVRFCVEARVVCAPSS